MVHGCRACLTIIKNPSEGFCFKAKCEPHDGSLMDKLTDCVPELLLDSVQDVILCRLCVSSLTSAYDFRQQILETQQKIFDYMQQVPLDTEFDMVKIGMHYKRLESLTDKPQTDNVKLDQKNNANKTTKEICVLCKYSCVDVCMLRQHMILHCSRNAPYKCDECAFIFPTAELLLDHLATHTKEKPYSCNLCDYLTDCHGKLMEHSCTHRKPFQCNLCWVRFYHPSKLQKHMKGEHNQQYQLKFKCNLCSYMCESSQKIESHIGNNHKSYSCAFCSIEFPSDLTLTKHLTVHRETKTCNVQKKSLTNTEAKTCDVQNKSVTNTYQFDAYVEDTYESSDDQVQNDLLVNELAKNTHFDESNKSNEIVHISDGTNVKIDCQNISLDATNSNDGSTNMDVSNNTVKSKRKRGKSKRGARIKIFLDSNKNSKSFIRMKLTEAIKKGLARPKKNIL